MQRRGCLWVAAGWREHAVIYRQCRGEWKLARVASRGGIVVSQAGKWRHCVCAAGELPLAPTLRVRGLAGGDEKGRPGWVALILRGCVNYLTTNLAPFWIAIPLKFLDTF